MEPLTIFGLACNIIQVVDFSAKLLSEANEIRHSTAGQTAEHFELQNVAEKLSQMCHGLDPATTHEERLECITEHRKATNDIAVSVKEAATSLIDTLRKLSSNGAPKKRWKSLRQALATSWKREQLENMQRRLDHLRTQLFTHIAAETNLMQRTIAHDLLVLKLQCRQDDQTRSDEIADLVDHVRKLRLSEDDCTKTRIEELAASLSNAKELNQRWKQEKWILDSLRFHTMFDRYHGITEAHSRTFDWIYNPSRFPEVDQRSKIQFLEWLRTGVEPFWISGKPGSGKSTLMRYLNDSPRTREYLQEWAEGSKLVVAAFYFWIAGSEMQRSQRGLWRLVLYEILRQDPSMIPTVCAERWHVIPGHQSQDWSMRDSRDALLRLKNTGSQTKICIFIDGLDEYDGDHEELIGMISELSQSPNIKSCIASRRWPCFEDAFGSIPRRKLYLEDLTRDDIIRFAQDKLDKFPGRTASHYENQLYSELIEEITRKAQGVFLWVFLVVRSLRRGISNGDDIRLLRCRLDEMPSDLERFFKRMLHSVDPVYRKRMAITFEVALRAPDSTSLLLHWLLDEEDTIWINRQLHTNTVRSLDPQILEEQMARRLYGRYQGLLEPTGLGKTRGVRLVGFLHRTVRDYLKTKEAHDIFSHPNVEPNHSACRALAACFKIWPGHIPDTNLEDFLLFARWAELQSKPVDAEVFEVFNEATCKWHGNDAVFLGECIRWGCLSGLSYLLARTPSLLQQRNEYVLRTAVLEQHPQVSAIFGKRASADALDWLLQHGARPDQPTNSGNLFIEFICSHQYDPLSPRGSGECWLTYDLWNQLLEIFLRHRPSLANAVSNLPLPFHMNLPWIGTDASWAPSLFYEASKPMVACSQEGAEFLHRQIRSYTIFLEHGLDVNQPTMWLQNCMTLWKIWLWTVVKMQMVHGAYEDERVQVIRLFLDFGADPHAELSLPMRDPTISRDLIQKAFHGQPSLNVEDIIRVYFGELHKESLLLAWSAATQGWQLEDGSKKRNLSSKDQESGHGPPKRRRQLKSS